MIRMDLDTADLSSAYAATRRVPRIAGKCVIHIGLYAIRMDGETPK